MEKLVESINQEKNRFTIDSIVDERALHEIYYKGFKRVLKEKGFDSYTTDSGNIVFSKK